MFALFNLKLTEKKDLKQLKMYGEYEIFSTHKEKICNNIQKYLLPDGKLDASAIEADWFPKIDAPVFISHSHDNENLAMHLAEFLYKTYQIKSFIDSTVWGSVYELLNDVDEKYAQQRKERNQNAANVYLILQGALMKMISQSKCLIFINTPESINIQETESPWIYNELLMANLFSQIRSVKTLTENAKFSYYVDLTKFTAIELQDIERECEGKTGVKALKALDELYEFKLDENKYLLKG